MSKKREVFLLPTRDQFKQLMAMDYDGPIRMINLLKFKPDGGRESYKQYGEAGTSIWEKYGVHPIFESDVHLPIIGDEEWDKILIAEYPSLSNFLDMNRDAKYIEKVLPYRQEALVDSRLFLIKVDESAHPSF